MCRFDAVSTEFISTPTVSWTISKSGKEEQREKIIRRKQGIQTQKNDEAEEIKAQEEENHKA